jgi:hypothetical protein
MLTGALGKRWLGEVWEVVMFGCVAIMAGVAASIWMDWKRRR